jgi:HEPN domain-containing protein
MRELFVASGRFDEALVTRAQEMERDRLAADYGGATFSRAASEAHVRDARRFVEAVERLIGAEPPGGGPG